MPVNLKAYAAIYQINHITMNKLLIAIGVAVLTGCASQKGSTTTKKELGNTLPPSQIQSIDDNTYILTSQATDKSYGYDKSNPIKVGGAKESSGPKNERRFLNGLLGPNGEEIRYNRAGSCCQFNTPNGLFANSGMLDIYKVSWKGSPDTLNIYINMYDKEELKVPVGLTAKK